MGPSREPRSKIPIVVAALSAVVLAILWLAIIQNIRGHHGKEPELAGSGRVGEESKEPGLAGSGPAGKDSKEPGSAGPERPGEQIISQQAAPATIGPVHPEDATLRPPVETQGPHTAPEPGTRLEAAPRPDDRPTRSSAARPLAPQPSRANLGERFPAHKGLAPECMAELERLCPDTAGGANRRTCFQAKESHLSGACQSQLQAMAVRIKQGVTSFKSACEPDIRQFCADVNPGGGRILQCLEDRYQEVSDPCYQTLRTKPFRK